MGIVLLLSVDLLLEYGGWGLGRGGGEMQGGIVNEESRGKVDGRGEMGGMGFACLHGLYFQRASAYGRSSNFSVFRKVAKWSIGLVKR